MIHGGSHAQTRRVFRCRRGDGGIRARAQIVPCSAVSDQGSRRSCSTTSSTRASAENFLQSLTSRLDANLDAGAGRARRGPEGPALRQTAAERAVRLHAIAGAGAERARRAHGGVGHDDGGQGLTRTAGQRGIDWLRDHPRPPRRAAVAEGARRLRDPASRDRHRQSWTICCGWWIRPAGLARMRLWRLDPSRCARRNGDEARKQLCAAGTLFTRLKAPTTEDASLARTRKAGGRRGDEGARRRALSGFLKQEGVALSCS